MATNQSIVVHYFIDNVPSAMNDFDQVRRAVVAGVVVREFGAPLDPSVLRKVNPI